MRLNDAQGRSPATLPITEASVDGSHGSSPVVIVDGKQQSIFSEAMTPEVYRNLNNILINSTDVVWVLPQAGHPNSSMIKGLLRTLRLEMPSGRLFLLRSHSIVLG